MISFKGESFSKTNQKTPREFSISNKKYFNFQKKTDQCNQEKKTKKNRKF